VFSVKLTEAQRVTTDVLRDATNLVRRWLQQASSMVRNKTSLTSDPAQWRVAVQRFIAGPCDEALRWVGEPKEKRRLSIWLLKDNNAKLGFWFSINSSKRRYAPIIRFWKGSSERPHAKNKP